MRRWWHRFKFPIVLIVSAINGLCALGALCFKIVPIAIVYAITFCNAILLLVLVMWLEKKPQQSSGRSSQSPQNVYNYKFNNRVNRHGIQEGFQGDKSKMGKNNTDGEGNATHDCQHLHDNFNAPNRNTPPRGKS
jgi:hypothetical protein